MERQSTVTCGAVFKRSSGLSELEEEFARFGIPFTSGLSQNFFQREEIRECLSLIEFLNNPQTI